jgi:hypothetical protein
MRQYGKNGGIAMPKNKQLIILCLLALIVASVSIREVGAIAPGTRVRLEPADLVVGLSETFIVQVVIEEVANLGGFEFDLIYDPSILQVQEVVVGDFLGSTEQSVVPVGPETNNAEGKTTFAAASFGSGPGPSGAGVLAIITCIARGEGSTVLRLQEVQVLDTALNTQPITVEDSRVVVMGAEGRTSAPEQTGVPEARDTPAPAAAAALPSPTTTPAAPITAPAPTGSSSWAMPGLMLAALLVAILTVIILIRRPEGE